MPKLSVDQPDNSWMKETSFTFKPGEEPDGFSSLVAGESVTIVLKGTVKTITQTSSADKDDDYSNSSLTVKRTGIEIQNGKRSSLNDAINKSRRRA